MPIALDKAQRFARDVLIRAWCLKNTMVRDEWRVPILCYHSVNSIPDRGFDPVPPKVFEQHLDHICTHHNVVPLRAVFKALAQDEALPSRSVALTFDDGCLDTFEVVFPLLQKYQAHATAFVVTGFLDGEIRLPESPDWPPMTWEQAREMDTSPVAELGAHGHTHRRLTALDHETVVREIQRSKEILEARLERSVDLFAYPYGLGPDIPPDAVVAVKDLGFLGACSTFWHSFHRPRERFILNRVAVYGRDTVEDLKRKLAGGYDFKYYLQMAEAFYSSRIRGTGIWQGSMGVVSPQARSGGRNRSSVPGPGPDRLN